MFFSYLYCTFEVLCTLNLHYQRGLFTGDMFAPSTSLQVTAAFTTLIALRFSTINFPSTHSLYSDRRC